MTDDERHFLSAAYSDATLIDRAVAAGITRDTFTDYRCSANWAMLCELRLQGADTDPASVYAAAVKAGTLDKLGGLAGITAASEAGAGQILNGPALMSVLLSGHARREAWKLLQRGKEMVEKDSANMAEVGSIAEQVVSVCNGKVHKNRTIDDIDSELEEQVRLAKLGKQDESRFVRWGLNRADRYMMPIRTHEYVLICARPSVGKSSMLTHLAAHNLMRGLPVAYFSLETSDKAVFSQMAAQRAGVNLAIMTEWMPEHYRMFEKARAELKASKRLLIFDDIMSLEGITARCRMLKNSFDPGAVFIDYMGLIKSEGGSQYERVTAVSNAMIGIRKMLGCPLIVASQLNRKFSSDQRGNKTEDRASEPTSEALRDSGHCEQDAHRIVFLHWRNSHQIDVSTRDYALLQTKCRDGVVTSVNNITFHAPTTRFIDNAN